MLGVETAGIRSRALLSFTRILQGRVAGQNHYSDGTMRFDGQSRPDEGERVMSPLVRLVEWPQGLQLGIGAGDASPGASASAPLPWVPTGVPGGFLDGAEAMAELGMVALVHLVCVLVGLFSTL